MTGQVCAHIQTFDNQPKVRQTQRQWNHLYCIKLGITRYEIVILVYLELYQYSRVILSYPELYMCQDSRCVGCLISAFLHSKVHWQLASYALIPRLDKLDHVSGEIEMARYRAITPTPSRARACQCVCMCFTAPTPPCARLRVRHEAREET
jgi:hypothetical protein